MAITGFDSKKTVRRPRDCPLKRFEKFIAELIASQRNVAGRDGSICQPPAGG